MAAASETVQRSVRTNGRDTQIDRPVKFLDYSFESQVSTPSGDTVSTSEQSRYEIWTETHSLRSKVRRERRSSAPNVHQVAVVEDFNLKSHKAGASNSSHKWRFW